MVTQQPSQIVVANYTQVVKHDISPAFNLYCSICGKLGHFAKVCTCYHNLNDFC